MMLALGTGCSGHDKLVGRDLEALAGRAATPPHISESDAGGVAGMATNGGNAGAAGSAIVTEGGAETVGTSGGTSAAAFPVGGSAGASSLGLGGTFGGGPTVGGRSNATGGHAGFAGSLGTGGAAKEPCAFVDCRRHSHCIASSDGRGSCVCDTGYAQDELQCYSTSPMVEVAAGDAHSCALRADGTVGCWGWNMDSPLGDGGMVDGSPIPLEVPGITNAIAIGAGGHASCALLADRTVKCWGFLGAAGAEPSPVVIEGLANVDSIAVGGPTTCAVLEDGSAYCWGLLSSTAAVVSVLPVKISRDDMPKVRTMYAGHGTIWAILEDDTVHVMADAGDTLEDEALLIQASRFSSGVDSKSPPCIVMQDGTVRCPEAHTSGGDAAWSFPTLPGYTDIVALARGVGFRCGVHKDGHVLCSGSNTYGELCDGTFTRRDDPRPALGLSNTTQIAASWFHACTINREGELHCWGSNSHGALGDGHFEFPLEIPGIVNAKQACVGAKSVCVLDDASMLRCWGDGYASTRPKEWLSSVSSCASGSPTCAVMQDGSAQCWGANDQGQLGDGSTVDRPAPVPVVDLAEVRQIATGSHSCAVRQDGSVYCWGKNDQGQLGDGTTIQRLVPVAVLGVTDAWTVAVGATRSCAALRDGSVRCWGENTHGQLGNGTTASATTATTAIGLTGIEGFVMFGDMTLALDRQGNTYKWGGWIAAPSGSETESIVDHTPHSWTTAPGQIAELATVDCVRLFSGEIQCRFDGGWGRALGWGETKSLASYSGLMCAITPSGHLLCRGVSWNGELGDSYISQRPWAERVASW